MSEGPGRASPREELAEEALEIDVQELAPRARYRLLTSLLVPRPIAWISTWGEDGTPNLAPYSYFAALSSSPALVGVSIGARRGRSKDTLVNIRRSGVFCINVVTAPHLESMNATSAELAPEVDEFALAGLMPAGAKRIDAPFVADCPAVMACELRREVDLAPSTNTLVIAEVVGVRLDPSLRPDEDFAVDPKALEPVGRLGGSGYALPGEVRLISRP